CDRPSARRCTCRILCAWCAASCSSATAGRRSFQMHGRSRCSCWSSSRSVRSEEHTSELQSRGHLVCRLLLEKKKNVTYGFLLRSIAVTTVGKYSATITADALVVRAA